MLPILQILSSLSSVFGAQTEHITLRLKGNPAKQFKNPGGSHVTLSRPLTWHCFRLDLHQRLMHRISGTYVVIQGYVDVDSPTILSVQG